MHCFDEREKCEHFRFNKCGVMHLPRGGGGWLTFKMKKATTPMALAIRAIRRPNIPITWRPIVKLNEKSQEEEVGQ